MFGDRQLIKYTLYISLKHTHTHTLHIIKLGFRYMENLLIYTSLLLNLDRNLYIYKGSFDCMTKDWFKSLNDWLKPLKGWLKPLKYWLEPLKLCSQLYLFYDDTFPIFTLSFYWVFFFLNTFANLDFKQRD